MEEANTVIQSKSLHLKTCINIIDTLRHTISNMREKFNSEMWECLKEEWKLLGLDEPKEPRKRKLPIRYDCGLTEPHIFTAKERYNKVYKEVIDFVLSGLASRFNSDSQLLLLNAESFLINLSVSPKAICDFYKDDLNIDRLELHRDMFHDIIQAKNLKVASFMDVLNVLKCQENCMIHLTELKKLVHLIMTVPITTCTTERSFSMLRRMKTYLRNTMTQKRLNHLSIINCHNAELDILDMGKIGNEFVKKTTIRSNTFAIRFANS